MLNISKLVIMEHDAFFSFSSPEGMQQAEFSIQIYVSHLILA